MPYIVIEDFKAGMDRRKKRVSGKPGQLWEGKNGHINRGGDYERRKKFVAKYNLPAAATKGLAAINGQIYVFGATTTPVGIPSGVNYQRLQHPSSGSAVIENILSVTAFSGKLYVVAEFDDGNIYHYYDGARVTSWDSVASSVASNNAVASALAAKIDSAAAYSATSLSNVITITAASAGTPFTISQSTVNGGTNPDQTITLAQTQANISAVAEVRASSAFNVTGGTSNPGTNKVTSITVDGVEVLSTAVDWATSNSATAAAIAAQINSYSSSPEYSALSDGAGVTIRAAVGTGAGPNGFNVVVSTAGDVTTSTPTTMGGGVTAVSAQAQIYTATIGGTFETADIFTITLDGQEYSVSGAAAGTGTFALTFQQKVYSITNSLLYFSALSSPTQFGSGVGSGFINISNQNALNESLTSIQEYQGNLAIFSRSNISIYAMDVDPALNTFRQTVQNTGTISPRSVIPYGNIDVFYLDDSGVRSLRARDSSNAPAVNDVGVAIDTFLREYAATLTEGQVQKAIGMIEPVDGRYWLAIGNRIFVFSYFPGSKINAWTYYDLVDEISTADVSDMARTGRQAFVRSADKIYLYGGDAGTTYPNNGEIECTLQIPFLSAGTPATFKGMGGFDIACEGTWLAKLLPDPNDTSVQIEIGTFNQITLSNAHNIIQHSCSLFAINLSCTTAGYACVSGMAIHYDAEEAL